MGPAFLASLAMHLCLAAIAFLGVWATARPPRRPPAAEQGGHVRLVWRPEPGTGRGGGGGGRGTAEPSRKAEQPGRDALTVRVAKPLALDPSKARTPSEPMPRLDMPVAALALGTETFPGAIDAPPSPTASQGPGHGGGVGTGRGTGDGPGRGPGLRDGSSGGTGGGFHRPGSDVTLPIELRKGAPQYTAEAMRARAQGAITVECVVQTTGVCTNIRVTRSLDPAFGLDQEAIKAAAQWRFRPGMRRGERARAGDDGNRVCAEVASSSMH